MVSSCSFRGSLGYDGELYKVTEKLAHYNNNHNNMQVIDLVKKIIYYNDSLNCNSGSSILPRMRFVGLCINTVLDIILLIREFIEQRYEHETGQTIDWTEWRTNMCPVYKLWYSSNNSYSLYLSV